MMHDRGTQLKVGMWVIGLSYCALPVGLVAIGGGPCAGPRNIAGSLILFVTGFCAVGAPSYGVFRVLQNFKRTQVGAWLLGAGAVVGACPVVFVGGFYLLMGTLSLNAFLH